MFPCNISQHCFKSKKDDKADFQTHCRFQTQRNFVKYRLWANGKGEANIYLKNLLRASLASLINLQQAHNKIKNKI